MMTVKHVAEILLSRKNSGYSFVLDGATRAKLGPDGFEYARYRGWVELDESTQCMRVSMLAVKLAEINMEAVRPDSETTSISPDAASPVSSVAERESATMHAQVMRDSLAPEVVCERIQNREPVVISGPDLSWSKLSVIANEMHPMHEMLEASAPLPTADDYNVGDDVIIGEDGKTFQATVQAKNSDGSLVLSFGDQKPPTVKPTYLPKEVARPQATDQVNKPQRSSQPAVKQPTTADSGPKVSTGPAAPGIGR